MLVCFFHANGQNKEATNWLHQSNANISVCINQYDNQRYNLLTNQTKVLLDSPIQHISCLGSQWQITSITSFISEAKDAMDCKISFRCVGGILSQASVSVNIDLAGWSEKNYVLMPASAYNGNRYQWRRLRYSPKLYDVKDIGPNEPIIINDIPKLSESGGVSRIQERSGSMTAPAIGFTLDSTKKGFWLLAKQGNALGDYGMGIEESRDRKKATLSIISPVVRELFCYLPTNAHSPSWDLPTTFKAGDEVMITFRMYSFAAPEIQTLFNKFCEIRKDVARNNKLVNTLPYSDCMQLLEQKFNEKNFVAQYGYYAVGMRENYLQDWQIGWTGGMISTYPLLFAGSEQTKQNVIRNFDWLFPNGISPSGFYWDAGQKGTEWIGGDIRNPHTKNWHLIRKSGDAVWYIIKQFALMEKMGISVKQSWKDGNQKVCDAFVKLWENNHQIGQFIDSQTGQIIVGGSSSGGIVPAALVLASHYYHQPNYLQTAKEIGNYYNENFTKKGIACGGPGDALQDFDSESAYALVESYTALYEVTLDKNWLHIAENAAKQFASWVVAYNYQFPDTSAYNKANIHTLGGVFANTQNKHSAPGICTASGIGLLKLYRYTGNTFYIDLLGDIAHNISQYLPHQKRPLGNAPIGYVSERINMTDWEGPGSIGYILPLSTWAETSLMLTTIEIPGLYVQPDKSFFKAFDNIEVTIKFETKRELVLMLTNATPVDASVSILAENSNQSKENLSDNYLYGINKINIKSGASTTISFKK